MAVEPDDIDPLDDWVARWPDFPAPLGRIGKATVWHLPTVREYLKGK